MIGVFGASGFIGRHLVRQLASEGLFIRAVSRSIDPSSAPSFSNVEVVRADLSDAAGMRSALKSVETAVHLISTSSPGFQNSKLIADLQENLIPHVKFLELCVEAEVRQVVYISSGGTVYGEAESLPISETHPTRPISSYGMTKLVLENYLQMFQRTNGLNHTILRASNPFGPGQEVRRGQGLIPAIVRSYQDGLAIQVFGDGSTIRDYIFISDLVEAISCVIANERSYNNIYNVGSGIGIRTIDVVHAVEAAIGADFRLEFIPDRPSDVKANVLDISKAKKELNWGVKHNFEESVEKTVLGMLNR